MGQGAGGTAQFTLIVLDTSAILATIDAKDAHHGAVVEILKEESQPWLIPALIMAEIGYMVETWISPMALDALLGDIENGIYRLDFERSATSRVKELVARYASMPLGFADAAVVTSAERNGRRILTVDRRHFNVVGRELDRLTLLP